MPKNFIIEGKLHYPNCTCIGCEIERELKCKKSYLRNHVRIRDENKCQNPWCKSGEPKKGNKKLDTHHIDIDDKNDSFWNIITVCHQCHRIAHRKRFKKYYMGLYHGIMIEKYAVFEIELKNNQIPIEMIRYKNDKFVFMDRSYY